MACTFCQRVLSIITFTLVNISSCFMHPGVHIVRYSKQLITRLSILSHIRIKTRSKFLLFRGNWVPLHPTFWLENLPLWSTEHYKKVELPFHDFCAQLFFLKKVKKSLASRIALNSQKTRNWPQFSVRYLNINFQGLD
jgi:hypothetical protein